MSEITDIGIVNLLLGYLLLLIPLGGLWFFKTGLLKGALVAVFRMTLQLFFVAFYLGFIFKLNNIWLNVLWIVVMVIIGAYTTVKRCRLNLKKFLLPFAISGLTSLLIIDGFFFGFLLELKYVMDARYLIPISGMVIGNALNHNIVGLSSYFEGITKNMDYYNFLLVNRNSRTVALQPFISQAIQAAINPMVARMATIGLISLPGMMTGQILGGSSPETAIKYQIFIMLAIFTGCTLNLLFAIYFSNRLAFDQYGRLKRGIIVRKALQSRL